MKIYENTHHALRIQHYSVLRTPCDRYAAFFYVGDFFHVFCNV